MIVTVVVLLLLSAGFQKANASYCRAADTSGSLSFQTSHDGARIPVTLPAGTSVELVCCARSFAAVHWTLNGRPLASIRSNFTLKERNQVVVTSPTPPAGKYCCTVSNATASIRNFFILSLNRIDESCSLGTVGSVVQPAPPKVNYRTHIGLTVQLKCTSVIYCGSPSLVSSVLWYKLDARGESGAYYFLYEGANVDALTGDNVRVTWRHSERPRKVLFVESILTIRNVTADDLYSKDLVPPNCSSSAGSQCAQTVSSTEFQCEIVLEESDDPSQSNYSLASTVRLHPDFLIPGVNQSWPKIGSKNKRKTRSTDALYKLRGAHVAPWVSFDYESRSVRTVRKANPPDHVEVPSGTVIATRLHLHYLWLSVCLLWTLLW